MFSGRSFVFSAVFLLFLASILSASAAVGSEAYAAASAESGDGSSLLGMAPYSGSPQRERTITIALWEEGVGRETIEKAVHDYEKETETDFNVIFIDRGSYWDRLAADAAGGRLPAVIEMDREHLRLFREKGLIVRIPSFPLYDGYALPMGLAYDSSPSSDAIAAAVLSGDAAALAEMFAGDAGVSGENLPYALFSATDVRPAVSAFAEALVSSPEVVSCFGEAPEMEDETLPPAGSAVMMELFSRMRESVESGEVTPEEAAAVFAGKAGAVLSGAEMR